MYILLYSLMVRVFVAEKYYSEKRNLCRDATAGGIISHHGLQTTRGASDHTDIEYIDGKGAITMAQQIGWLCDCYLAL
jgi:hypothetical protein